MDITFLGATGTVTGSKYLIGSGKSRILVDCGLFQGYKHLRLRNRAPFPIDPKEIGAVVLTHAHIDHSGHLPLLVKNGFSGKIYCSAATKDLCAILLPDSGHLQEEEARYANKRGSSKHRPALPLYTLEDAQHALKQFTPIAFDKEIDLGSISARLIPNGHILGSGCALLKDRHTSLLFSGDLGRPNDLIMREPAAVQRADYLVMESTYGNRRHDPSDPQIALAEIIHRTVARNGVMVIPSFAVGRAQTLLYYIHLLKATQSIPDIPVFLDSPMAADATRIFHEHRALHRLTDAQCDAMCRAAHIVNSPEESKALDQRRGPMIIISASGMATGGRVLHHLKTFAPDARNTILFAGFQAGGTRGAAMLNGAKNIKIFGEYVPLRAEVVALHNLSAHADYGEILDWLEHFHAAP
ncbi:MAG: MBL fold metallo-hydrolase, partial [Gammaproteobacteria bacterium]|nr:MBL fold metallo-hydrolase [Gammaproteobacteria bacterium]